MRLDLLAYRVLLRAFPAELRRQFGDDMTTMFAKQIEEARPARRRVVRVWIRAVIDALSNGAAERLSPRPQQPPSFKWRSLAMLYDLRHAFRLVRRAPAFSLLVIATLALAIGANTAIFSVVNGVLLRPLPFADPDRLVLMYENVIAQGPPFGFSPPDYAAFRERARGFDGLAAFRNVEFELSGVDQPERITAAKISAELLTVLGTPPALGRGFTVDEDRGRQLVAILSDGLWRRKFGADPAVVGGSIALDRRVYTVVGVMPRPFSFPLRGPHLNNVPADVYVPEAFTAGELNAFGSMYNNTVVGRLKPGVTAAQAAADASALMKQLFGDMYPAPLRELAGSVTATITPFRQDVVRNVSRALYVLLAAVGVVLLIACADIACLMLTRAAARSREMAIRTALGANRGRVIRLALIETAVLALVGGAAGLALAWWAQQALVAAAPISIPRASEIGFDTRVLLFTLGVSLLAALICGVLPALESTRRDSAHALKESGRTATTSARQRRIFAVLVTTQFACAVVLLASGGLLIRSFARLTATNPGFDAAHVITAATSLPASSYPAGSDVRSFYARLLERARAMPGVSAAAAATDLPLAVRERRVFTIETPPAATASLRRMVATDWVAGDYFTVIGARIVSGRGLSDIDTAASERVVVINEALARRFWGDQDPVGQRIAWGLTNDHGPWMRIVGVIGDIKLAGLAAPTEPATWQPWSQVPDATVASSIVGIYRSLRLMMRSDLGLEALVPTIRREVRALDPALPVTEIQTLADVVGASVAPQRFNTALLGGFAAVALLLAALGIAGVLAISVAQRTPEIGIRLALGADPRTVIRMVVREGMLLVAAGLAIGLPAAFAAARLLRSLLFETTPHDLLSFTSAAAVLCAVALAACAVPALRASRVSPVAALRID
jgi:putative ABC transport system permease protein